MHILLATNWSLGHMIWLRGYGDIVKTRSTPRQFQNSGVNQVVFWLQCMCCALVRVSPGFTEGQRSEVRLNTVNSEVE